jgi:hypothetical protein
MLMVDNLQRTASILFTNLIVILIYLSQSLWLFLVEPSPSGR